MFKTFAAARQGLRRLALRFRLLRQDKLAGKRGIVLSPARQSPETRRYLAVVALARNEGRYLREWLEFHRLVGVEHAFLYDDGSSDDSAEILRPYISSGFVTCLPWARWDKAASQQRHAYAHALRAFGADWRWMAFIDLDEFLFPVEAESLIGVLSAYEDLPAIATHWHMFGTSGHKQRPAGLVIENYTLRARIPSAADPTGALAKWKSVVDPARVRVVDSQHLFKLEERRIAGAYDENRRWITRETVRPTGTSNVLRLNHYFTRSAEDFSAKLARGPVGVDDLGARHKQNQRCQRLAEMIEKDTVRDDTILRFAPPLRERLGEGFVR
jgi:hypothetical protein